MKALTSVIFKNDARKDLREDSTVIEKLFAVLSFIIVFGTVAGTITWASIYITKKLIEMNQPFVFIEIMLIGNFAILFFESIFQVLNSLYFSNDLKSILRMPINARSIIHAKLLKLITSEYQMETIMLAIPMTVYGVLNGVGIQFYLYIPIMLVVLPIIPICIITIIVALIMRFTNSIKNKSKVMYLTIIIAFLIVNFLSIIFGGNKIGVILVQPIINSIENYNVTIGIKNISYYVLASFITYIFTLIVTAPIYIKGAIGTVINAEKIKDRKEITINDFNEKTYKKSYLLKNFLY